MMRLAVAPLLVMALAGPVCGEPATRDPWADWQTILYQARAPAQLTALRRIGLTGGMVFANRDDPAHPDPAALDTLLQQGLPWYVENIATDYYAAYHRWRPGRTEAAAFIAVQQEHRDAPEDVRPFIRQPGLSDAAAFLPIHDRLVQTVQAHARYHPLYYSLADEPGIADLAAAWDFDFAPASLAGFRTWLGTQYESLNALNQEWGTAFATWDDVIPASTDQAMARDDGNFAAWADFKAWMDVAFSRAVRAGTDAIHEADPRALAAIEGAQIPGWGGYDYARLASAVDVMELYDFGENVAMAHSFNPALRLLTTVVGHDAPQVHGLWRAVLQGARGAILWDADDRLADADGGLGEDGRRLEPALRALHGGVGALLIDATPEPAPVAIVASQASFRTEWMLARKPAGAAWAERGAESEYEDTAMRAATRGFSHLLAHLGLAGRFVTPRMIADGTLARDGVRALILPHTLALAPAEAAAIRGFADGGGLVIADIVPGAFDSHSRAQPQPALADLFPAHATLFRLGDGAMPDAGDGREPVALARLTALLGQAGVTPDFRLSTADGRFANDITIARYRLGATMLYALHRDLPPAGALAREVVSLDLPQPRSVYAVLTGRALGRTARLDLGLDPVTPTLLALSATPLAAPVVIAPGQAVAGGDSVVQLQGGGETVLHVAVADPAGVADDRYSGNVAAGRASWAIRFAPDDRAGAWTVTATDVASGLHASAAIVVGAPDPPEPGH